MKRSSVQVALGAVVLAAGVVLLLQAVGVPVPTAVWALVLAAGAGVFGFVFVADPESWWAAIPGSALLGAAVATVMGLDPNGLGRWTGVPVPAMIGIGFWAIYLRDTRRWWAVIPGGALVTVAVVAGLAPSVPAVVAGAVFLLGIAVTFALVALVPPDARGRWWAWIPAAALTVCAVAVLMSAAEWFLVLNIVWPIAVIVAGGFLIGRAVRKRVHSGQH